jgi:hypothetical protein
MPKVGSYMESLAEIGWRMEHGGPKSRHTQYNGVEMRSRLEVRFARHLSAIGEEWRYEPRVYGRRGHGYLPDFEILGAARPTFIEVKPTIAEAGAAELKMAVIWNVHRDALLVVACEEGCTYFGALRGGPWEQWQERWAA